MICDRCYGDTAVGEHGLWKCPLEQRRKANAIWVDEIPGGLEISNGICNEDGTPKRYYSKSAIREACKAKGVIPYHDVYSEGGNQTLSDARHREDWLRTSTAQREKRWRDEARREKAHQ
jgi:hypothetical protein